jgi:hypothetical protein
VRRREKRGAWSEKDLRLVPDIENAKGTEHHIAGHAAWGSLSDECQSVRARKAIN